MVTYSIYVVISYNETVFAAFSLVLMFSATFRAHFLDVVPCEAHGEASDSLTIGLLNWIEQFLCVIMHSTFFNW